MSTDEWMERGKCRTTGANPDWFYPEQGQRSHVTAAKFCCAGCPVNSQCLDFALSNMDIWEVGREGIWGGTTAKERVKMLADAGLLVRSGHGYRTGRSKSRVA
jgi:WhiB family redox-sensing transcriptional regulator